MADAVYYTKQQQLQKQATPSRIYSHFLYKALIVTIFLLILPLFPSQAPEFINHTLNTRGWEFLQLLFVGIAVSYGLFSRRSDETEKENSNNNNYYYYHSRLDNAQSYLSRFLQVSSVFDDEADSSPRAADLNKVQTWSNEYNRNEPVVVVVDEQPVPDEQQLGASLRISERPLLLPARSLRSRVVDVDANESRKESAGVSTSISRSGSNSSFERLSCDFSSKSEKSERLDQQELGGELKDNVVLPSPIPWRTRSGRMEIKEMKEEDDSPSLFAPPSSMEEAEFNRYSIAKVPRSTRSNSTNSSPKLSPSSSMSLHKKTSPSPSFSFGARGKTAEDSVRKKSIYRSPPPPPPPPPPPAIRRSTSLMTPRPNVIDDGEFGKNDFKRSFTSKPKDVNKVGNVAVPKSVKAIKSYDPLAGAWVERGFEDRINNKTGGFDQLPFKAERLNRDNITRMPQPTFREFPEEEKEGVVEKLVAECDEGSESEEEEEDGIAEISAVSDAVSSKRDEQSTSSSANDGGPDVDKKADEFIAKFREQIRLQRIESIKRSSAKISKKGPR